MMAGDLCLLELPCNHGERKRNDNAGAEHYNRQKPLTPIRRQGECQGA